MNLTEQMTSGEWLARQQKREEDRAKKPDAPKKPKSEPEHQMQCEIYVDFNRNYPDYRGLLFAVPNGAKLPYKMKIIKGQKVRVSPEANKLIAEGLVAGIPDMMLAVARGGWHGLFLENKVLPNKPTPEQLRKMEELTRQGYMCQVCTSREYAEWIIAEYMNLPPIPGSEIDPYQELREINPELFKGQKLNKPSYRR